MPETSYRNRSIRQLSLAVVITAVFVGLILMVVGIFVMAKPTSGAVGVFFLVPGMALIAFSLLFQALVSIALKAEANISRIHNDALDLLDSLRRIEPLIKTITHNSQISDAARSITHRETEREALRQAIRDEMFGGDWEAALYLIDQMERRFGYVQEAKALRVELNQVREMTIEEKIGEAVSHIEKQLSEYRWERARIESERLMKLFPRHERVMELPAELSRRREARKQELLAQWKVAVERNEIDKGINILTELDQYLTPREAQWLQDSARHVFKARLLNLGVQFSLAVSEARWRDALETGVHIRQEFPNSRMAQEVADKIDTLRVRAGFVADTEAIQHRPPATG